MSFFKKIAKQSTNDNRLEWFNNSQGINIGAYCEFNDNINCLTISDVDALSELKKDIEEQLEFQLSLLKK